MKISVALCTYNGEKYIEQQLESIFSQSVAVSEIVICDDYSSDETVRKIKKISFQHPGVIRLINNQQNIGFRKNFEKSLRVCQGDYIFFCDQDDIWRQDKVEKSVAYLKCSGNYGVFTDARLIDEEGKNLGISLFDRFNVYQYINNRNKYPDLFATLCLSLNFVTGATLAISKEAIPIVLPFRTSSVIYHDYYISLKLSAIGKLGYLTDRLTSYRIHPDQHVGINFGPASNCRLFDFEPKIESRNDFFQYLIGQRKRTLSIITVCKFNKKERKNLSRSYRAFISTIIKQFPKFYRMKKLFEFYYFELYVKSYLLLK